MANIHGELKGIIFAQGFERTTDIDIGPDDYIYILSLYVGGGSNCNTKFPDIAESREKNQ